jgi:hypothetical protein
MKGVFVSTRLEALIEQTDFLLEKQMEALAEAEQIFAEFSNTAEEQLATKSLTDQDRKSLGNICTIIKNHTEAITGQMQEDIDFLTEQLAALKQISSISDQTKAKELLNMMIDENEEISETEEFKENVAKESILAKQNLTAIVSDLTDALKEEKFRDVELFLETMQAEMDEECEESDCDCCSSECDSKKCPGMDIFKGICDDDDCDEIK